MTDYVAIHENDPAHDPADTFCTCYSCTFPKEECRRQFRMSYAVMDILIAHYSRPENKHLTVYIFGPETQLIDYTTHNVIEAILNWEEWHSVQFIPNAVQIGLYVETTPFCCTGRMNDADCLCPPF